MLTLIIQNSSFDSVNRYILTFLGLVLCLVFNIIAVLVCSLQGGGSVCCSISIFYLFSIIAYFLLLDYLCIYLFSFSVQFV